MLNVMSELAGRGGDVRTPMQMLNSAPVDNTSVTMDVPNASTELTRTNVTSLLHQLATNENVSFFSLNNNILLPQDLVAYFIQLNGTFDGYDDMLFKFYSLSQFKTVKDELGEWEGVPDYRNIVTKLNNHEDCFVFAGHSFHLLSYAIRLYTYPSDINEVYVICGEEFKIVATSFTEFMNLYLHDDPKLYL